LIIEPLLIFSPDRGIVGALGAERKSDCRKREGA
jgi:hypothetical protein